MIFIVALPGVATGDVRYKWLAAGTLGSALSTGITQIGAFPMFRIDADPPADAEELIAYDVNDETNYSLGHYQQLASLAHLDADVSSRLAAADIDLEAGKVNVGKLNDQALLGTGQPGDLWRGA